MVEVGARALANGILQEQGPDGNIRPAREDGEERRRGKVQGAGTGGARASPGGCGIAADKAR